jgi:hypothetical protein
VGEPRGIRCEIEVRTQEANSSAALGMTNEWSIGITHSLKAVLLSRTFLRGCGKYVCEKPFLVNGVLTDGWIGVLWVGVDVLGTLAAAGVRDEAAASIQLSIRI